MPNTTLWRDPYRFTTPTTDFLCQIINTTHTCRMDKPNYHVFARVKSYASALIFIWFGLSLCYTQAKSDSTGDKLIAHKTSALRLFTIRHFPRPGGQSVSQYRHEIIPKSDLSLNRLLLQRRGPSEIRPTYSPTDDTSGEITGMWAVKLKFGEENDSRELLDMSANMIARQHGLENHGQIGELKGYYLFAKKGSPEVWTTMASAVVSSPPADTRQETELRDEMDTPKPTAGWNLERRLLSHTQVEWQGHQVLLTRSKRGHVVAKDVINDNIDVPYGDPSTERKNKGEVRGANSDDTTVYASHAIPRSTTASPSSNADEDNSWPFYLNLLNHDSSATTALPHRFDFTDNSRRSASASSKASGGRRMGVSTSHESLASNWYPSSSTPPSSITAVFNDPLYARQWHLENTAGTGDCNVTGVWKYGITGKGVVVAVVDDGVQWNHPDLIQNYCPEGSFDLNANDDDPMPVLDDKEENKHGTRCAGEIAAAPNNHCGVGVAYGARFSGIRILDGPLTDSMEAAAFNKHLDINDIYSCSWGPEDDGKTVDGPHPLAQAALKHGIVAGRRGLGSIYIVASGNGGHKADNCNYDGYANSIYTLTIGAVDEFGHIPSYAEECASMLACTFSSGAGSEDGNARKIVTTDWTMSKNQRRVGGCTESHTGTSAATPLAAGMVALMLEVRPCLTWRDIQHIIVMTSLKIQPHEKEWTVNMAGFHHSDRRGFGLMNAWRLVNAAYVWQPVPWLTSLKVECYDRRKIIPNTKKRALILKMLVTKAQCYKNMVYALEQVLVTVDIEHPRRGDLFISLVCPSGTTSVIGRPRRFDDSSNGLWNWTFTTVKCWGEQSYGMYRLIIHDTSDRPRAIKGELRNWKLLLYGSAMSPGDIDAQRARVEEAISGKYLQNLSNTLNSAEEARLEQQNETIPPKKWTIGYCPPMGRGDYETMSIMRKSPTERMLKLLALSGCFLLIWGIYCLIDGTAIRELIISMYAKRNGQLEQSQCRSYHTL